ncbi:MAG: exodeoxyribonuclease VII small subunit [Burkholderiaceae bacterium]|jgi:exodeoxyribonuclease VII small subunit
MNEVDDISTLSFEAAMAALERETARLEGGQLPLAEALKAYERGVSLMRHAQGLLEAAQKELEIIDARGTTTVPLSDVLGERA